MEQGVQAVCPRRTSRLQTDADFVICHCLSLWAHHFFDPPLIFLTPPYFFDPPPSGPFLCQCSTLLFQTPPLIFLTPPPLIFLTPPPLIFLTPPLIFLTPPLIYLTLWSFTVSVHCPTLACAALGELKTLVQLLRVFQTWCRAMPGL